MKALLQPTPSRHAPTPSQKQIPASDTKIKPLTCLDLFCGCGGFSLGLQRAGFYVLAAIDFNSEAIATFRTNLVERSQPGLIPVARAIEADLTQLHPQRLAEVIGTDHVDVIVGGPPCQGFSTARQRDGANHGCRRFVHDERRQLYREFLRHVGFFKPRVFVMENVLGIRSAAGGEYLTRVQKEARSLGYRVHGQIEDAWELGVPQKRRRQLFIGVRLDVTDYFLPTLQPAPKAQPRIVLGAAIGDLPILRSGNGNHENDYDLDRRENHLRNGGIKAKRYLFNVLEIQCAPKLTNHVARPHSERDLRDFALLREGENSATAMRDRGVDFEFPYDKSSFKDRYTRQSREHPCSTIVAHLSKDGLMFIHPTQNRSLTPREAARVQSFPDWFVFPRAQTHAFRLIGNAVPPLVGEAVGLAVRKFLIETVTAPSITNRTVRGRQDQHHHRERLECEENCFFGWERLSLQKIRQTAASELESLARLDRRQLRALPVDIFLRGWHALLFLFPHLHPDNAHDHGTMQEEISPDQLALPGYETLLSKCYTRSGWPVALTLIGEEAWRRYETREINRHELYCAKMQNTGQTHIAPLKHS